MIDTEYDTNTQLFKINIHNISTIPPGIYNVEDTFRVEYVDNFHGKHDFILTNNSLSILTSVQNHEITIANVSEKLSESLIDHFAKVSEEFAPIIHIGPSETETFHVKKISKDKNQIDGIKKSSDMFRWWIFKDEQRNRILRDFKYQSSVILNDDDYVFFVSCIEKFRDRETTQTFYSNYLSFEHFIDGFGEEHFYISHISLALCLHLLRSKKAMLGGYYYTNSPIKFKFDNNYLVEFLPDGYDSPIIVHDNGDAVGLAKFVDDNKLTSFTLTAATPKLEFTKYEYGYFIENVKTKLKSENIPCNGNMINRNMLRAAIHLILEKEPCCTVSENGIHITM